MKRVLIAATALLLSGCATMVDGPIKSRIGMPIADVISQIGAPDSERVIAGRTYYTWTRENDGLKCTLNYRVDAAGKVDDYDWQGQLSACNFGGINPLLV